VVVRRITPFRERLKRKKKIILFLSTGDTCRSTMACGYFRQLINDHKLKGVELRSAGVMTITGLLASQEAIQVMETEGVDLRGHRSTQLTPELIRKADLILAMTPFHRQTALRMSEDAKSRTYLFKEYTGADIADLKNVQIADPMGCTLEVFKKCFKEIKTACIKLLDHEFVAGKKDSAKSRTAAGRTRAAKFTKSRVTKKPATKKTVKKKKSNKNATFPKKSPQKSAPAKSAAKKKP
jgi:protein-tyrosine-phosphatase